MEHSARHMTASAVVVDVDAEFVLLIHHNATGKLMFPGGHIDDGESPGEAVLREVAEETGIRPRLALQDRFDLPGMAQRETPWLVYEIPAPSKPARPGKPAQPPHTHIDMLFIATASSIQIPRAQESEVSDAGWYDLHDLRRFDVREEVPQVTMRAFQLLTRPRRNDGLMIAGSGSVAIRGSAFGAGATVIN